MNNIYCDYHTHIGRFYDVYYDYSNVYTSLKNNGINKCVVSYLSPLTKSSSEAFDFYTQMLQICKESDEYAKSIKLDAILYYWVDPLLIDKILSLDEIMSNSIFKGFKIHPFLNDWNPENPEKTQLLTKVFKYAKKNNLPILFHTGVSPTDNPLLFEEWYKNYPEVDVQLAHCKDAEPILYLLSKYKNLYGDTAFCPNDSYEKICNAGFKDRMRFGTDFPITHWYDFNKEKIINENILTNNYKSTIMKNAFK